MENKEQEEKNKKGTKDGRPKKEIDYKQLDKLCAFFCTLTEIASFFEVSEDTIERRIKEDFKMLFSEYWKIKASTGKISLRKSQFQSALAGNTTMQIWLGKQYLNQGDYKETEDKNIEIKIIHNEKPKSVEVEEF